MSFSLDVEDSSKFLVCSPQIPSFGRKKCSLDFIIGAINNLLIILPCFFSTIADSGKRTHARTSA